MSFSFNPHGFQLMYSLISVFMWAVALLFSIEYMEHYKAKKRYYIFMVATFFATFGVLLSGDLMTTFVAFEVMSFTSYVLVIHEENAKCMRAGETYLAVAVIGGMCMLIGLMLLYDLLGTLRISELGAGALPYAGSARLYTASALILVGFGAKAGMFPLHIWLPKAHPVAPAPASALLSGILTKAGIFGALVICTRFFIGDFSWGGWILRIGVITMFLGALLALFSVDLKRTLACSSVSQIGFITVGIGLMCMLGDENIIAARGTILHMVNHSMLKLLLFSCAGAVYMKVHTLDLNTLRGYGRNKQLLKILFAVGGLSIAGIPATSGYVSKTLLHEGIVELIKHIEHMGYSFTGNYEFFEWVFLISGGMTLAYMLKLFVCIFVEKNTDPKLQKKYDSSETAMNTLSSVVISLPAAILLLLGFFPYSLMDGIARICTPFLQISDSVWEEAGHVNYLSAENLKGSCISILIGLFLYFVVVRHLLSGKQKKRSTEGAALSYEYLDVWPKWLDLEDSVYRPLIKLILKVLSLVYLLDEIVEPFISLVFRLLQLFCLGLAEITDLLIRIFGGTIFRPLSVDRFHIYAEKMRSKALVHSVLGTGGRANDFASTLSAGILATLIGACIFLWFMLK